MGEKIRDLHDISIGDASLMIELNEGYSASQGRLIHIQNKKFRYLLTERNFYQLSSMVMRAWSEFDFLKNKKRTIAKDFPVRESVKNESNNAFREYLTYMDKSGIGYRVIDVQDKMITLLVDKKSNNKILQKDMKEIPHPYGKETGYRFLYQMTPFKLYKKQDYYIEVYNQLPCGSLTAKTWIPLDRAIQQRAWGDYELKDGIKWCDGICRYLYHLCWAIFKHNGFSPFEMQYLKENRELLKTEEFMHCASLVFFSYTDKLIEHLYKGDYYAVIHEYYSFIGY
ncbi:MAG: hypothetical protein IK057_02410 [Clostridia bacterium]|nr:hypothetical protein [Clostridia bacterium]